MRNTLIVLTLLLMSCSQATYTNKDCLHGSVHVYFKGFNEAELDSVVVMYKSNTNFDSLKSIFTGKAQFWDWEHQKTEYANIPSLSIYAEDDYVISFPKAGKTYTMTNFTEVNFIQRVKCESQSRCGSCYTNIIDCSIDSAHQSIQHIDGMGDFFLLSK